MALVVVFLSINTISVFAQGFTDIKDGYWAKDYIDKLVELKVVNGFDDGTYKPQDNVSKLATLVMIYKSVKAADKLGEFNEENAIKKYFYTLQQYSIPEWAKAPVAYALNEEIILLNDLMGMYNSGGSQKDATRSEVAVYVGKLLAKFLDENVQTSFVALNFKDSVYISSKDAPYIDLLSKKKILSGDEQGNFNPNEPIQRSAIAKIIALSYDIIKTQTIVEEQVKEVSGVLMHILDNNTILVQDDDDNKSLHTLDDNTEVIINDKISNKNALVEKQDVKVFVREDGTVKSIIIDQAVVAMKGKFTSLVSMGDYVLVMVEDENDVKKTFKATAKTDVYLNDSESSLTLVKKNDTVELEIDGDVLKSIRAHSRERKYTGILDKAIFFEDNPMLTIRTDKQNIYTFEIDDDPYVKRNGRSSDISKLIKGDIIDITVEKEKVERIIAKTIEKETEGVISEIVMGTVNKITIESDDGEKFEYELADDCDIEVDDDDVTINELKVGYKVEFEIESDVVTDIEAEKIDTSDKIDGVIIDVFSEYKAIKVKGKVDGRDETFLVDVDDADISSVSGTSRRFSSLDDGDEVFIYGEKASGMFEFKAKAVIIVKDK